MANLRTLLNQRSAQTDISAEAGAVTLFSPYKMSAQSYCWRSPGTGVAIIEVWGAGGGGAGGQCCGTGIPGNSGAYSKAYVNVNSSGFVCGSVGGALAASSCLGCRGCCSFACIAPLGTLNRVMTSQAGFGGRWFCGQGSSTYCCILGQGYCASNQFYSAGCGFICNIGVTVNGHGTITAAVASGGDVNISGGISCAEFCGCNTPTGNEQSRFFHSYPAGLRSCQPGTVRVCYCEASTSQFSRGEAAFEMSYAKLNGSGSVTRGHIYQTGQGFTDCGCFTPTCHNSPGIVGAGYGSLASISGGETTPTCGSLGGPGLVKITFIS